MQNKLFLSFVILVSLNLNPAYAGIVEDQLIRQLLLELRDIGRSMRPYLSGSDSLKLLKNIRAALTKGVKDKIKCEVTGTTDVILRLGSVSSKILNKQCPAERNTAEDIEFTPKFSHCTSSADLECVCSHPQHKDKPQCALFVNKKDTSKKCIPQEIASSTAQRINEITNSLSSAFSADSDNNGISDVCEDGL